MIGLAVMVVAGLAGVHVHHHPADGIGGHVCFAGCFNSCDSCRSFTEERYCMGFGGDSFVHDWGQRRIKLPYK